MVGEGYPFEQAGENSRSKRIFDKVRRNRVVRSSTLAALLLLILVFVWQRISHFDRINKEDSFAFVHFYTLISQDHFSFELYYLEHSFYRSLDNGLIFQPTALEIASYL